MSDALVWKEPPPPRSHTGRGDGKWQRRAKDLEKRPGKWALILAGTRNETDYPFEALKRYGCEVTRRIEADTGEWELYGRWPK